MMDYTNPNDPWRHLEYDPFKDMDDDERLKAACYQGITFFVMILAMMLLCFLFGGCKSVEYVPVIEQKTDTLWQNHTQHDSIWLHDSIHVWQGSDTVKIEKWHTKYVLKEIHDTTYISKTDSVHTPYPVIKKVPAELTWWQQTRLHIINIILYGLGFWGLFWILKSKLKWL